MPSVSVLMPCFNAAVTLGEALDSLAEQTMDDFEVVAVDDGSGDETLGILENRAARDKRFRVIAQNHAGIIAALNTGLVACRAPYIARMDSDDRSHPRRLELQADYLDKNTDTALVSCLVSGFPQDQVREGFRLYMEWQNSLVDDSDIRREIFIESPFAHPSVMVRKDWMDRVGGYQEKGWAEDYDLWLRLFLAGARFGKVSQHLLDWREYPERLTRSDSRYSLENFLRAKAYYLVKGPLIGRDAVIIWGAGMMGKRLSKHLIKHGCPLVAFIDIDPRKIGRTRRGRPVLHPQELLACWKRYENPVLLAAVGARGARSLIKGQLSEQGLQEGEDWWSVA